MNYTSQKCLVSFLFILFSIASFGQGTGKIAGRVTDKFTLETLIGLSATIPGTSLGSATNFDGNYEIPNLVPGVYTVQFKYIGYTTKAVSGVLVVVGKTTELNVIMEETVSTQVAEVVITSTFSRETINSLYSVQQNAISVSDGISADVIRKSPDRSSADILKRVSGASIQGGRFVIVRGMNDRYNLAYLNNSSLPSTEADRKAFTFDIFPAGIIDNITIIKTFSPEYKADFAGGIIKVNTKQIPESNSGSISFSGGYNTITTGKSFFKHKSGKTDWLGIDDGTRLLPNDFPDTDTFRDSTTNGIDRNTKLSRTLNDDWSVKNKNASPNLSFQMNKANVFKLKNVAIGTFAALSYNNNNRFGRISRFSVDDVNLDRLDSIELDKYSNQVLWGGLFNIGLKISDHSTIAIRNLYNVNSENTTFIGSGETNDELKLRFWTYFFYSNQMFTNQVEGDHTIKLKNKYKPKINWNFNYNNLEKNIPDFRTTTGSVAENGKLNLGGQTERYFSELREDYYSGKVDITLPLNFSNVQNDLKVGYFYEDRSRTFDAKQFEFQLTPNSNRDSLSNLPLDSIFLNQNINTTNGWFLNERSPTDNSYIANTQLSAFYVLMDTKIAKWVRASYGFRSEKFTQFLSKVKPNDSLVLEDQVDESYTKIFPAINITFPITEKENLRFSYSETINRPEFREQAVVFFLDFETNLNIYGNPQLKPALINNFDFKYEFFPNQGEVFSVSAFYKSILDPIEFAAANAGSSSSNYRYVNASKAYCFGIELEGRKNLGFLANVLGIDFFRKLTLYSNLAIIESESNYQGTLPNETGFAGKRVFQGQSPYLYNGGLIYDDIEKGWSSGILVNVTGRRLFAGGGFGFLDRYESARTVVDFQLSKRIKKLEFRVSVNDLFATNLYFYKNSLNKFDTLNYEKETDAVVNTFRFGTQVNFRVGFNF